MFENQHAAPASPEPRGRSPATSSLTSDTDLDGRPRSKIRASFVSVEPSGGLPGTPAKDFGTTKVTPDGVTGTPAHQRESLSPLSRNGDNEVAQELKRTLSQETEDSKKGSEKEEAILELAVKEQDSPTPAPKRSKVVSANMVNLGSIMKGSDFPEPEDTREKGKGKATEPVAAPKPVEKVVEPVAPANTAPGKATPSKVVEKAAPVVEKKEPVKVAPKPKEEPVKAAPKPKEEVPKPKEEVPKPKEEAPKPKEEVPKPNEEVPKPEEEVLASSSEMPPPPAKEPTKLTEAAPEEPKEAAKPKEPIVPAAAAAEPKPKVNGTSSHTRVPGKAPVKAAVNKPPAISTHDAPKASSAKGNTIAKSPALPKTPRTPTTPKMAHASVASKAKAPVEKPKRTSTATAGAVAPPAASKAKAPVKDNPVTTSPFRKPRPKSPTRPVRLPSHLTAPTASYAAKHEDGSTAPQTLSRKSSNISRDRNAALKPAATVKVQPSRVSLPAQITKRPESRQSLKGPDEGFLARMMRPTASSASKTHEKVNSPPRRTASVKPKTGHEGLAAKGKRKLAEGASKAKEAVTNGNNERHDDDAEPAEHADNEETVAGHEEPGREPTPVTQTEEAAPVGDILQTPNFEGQTIR
jgi:hypothetical protein